MNGKWMAKEKEKGEEIRKMRKRMKESKSCLALRLFPQTVRVDCKHARRRLCD
jgi:hypothetical protein